MIFKKLLNKEEIHLFLQDNINKIKDISFQFANIINKPQASSQKINIVQKNYLKLCQILIEKDIPNNKNIYLHYICTVSNYYRIISRIDEAKNLLKSIQKYIQQTNIDMPLLAICLNNYANLQINKNKFQRAFGICSKGRKIIKKHIKQIEQLNKLDRVCEDVVILIMILIHAKLSIKNMMKIQYHKQYDNVYQQLNNQGIFYIEKYLGKKSKLKQYFPKKAIIKKYQLPFIPSSSKQKKKDTSRQKIILQKLNQINDKLNLQQQKTQIIIVNQQNNNIKPKELIHKISSNTQSKNQIVVINQISARSESEVKKSQVSIEKQIKHIEIESNKSVLQISLINLVQKKQQKKIQIKIKHKKGINRQDGKLLIQTKQLVQNTQSFHITQINYLTLQKLITQINYEDKLPYQLLHQSLLDQEFVQYNILPFLNVNYNCKIQILPRSLGLLKPYKIKLLQIQSLVFFNHIRQNLFRIALSPLYMAQSIYLNIQFIGEQMQKYFLLEQQKSDLMLSSLRKSSDNFINATIKLNSSIKICKIKKQQQLQLYLTKIISNFQQVLLNFDQQISFPQIIANQSYYFKFQELNQNQNGCFYIIRYLSKINCFDIYLKNNFSTFAIEQNVKARGSILHRPNQFLQNFGIPLKNKNTRLKILAYSQIIAKQYTLLTFDRQLSQDDRDKYVQNAITKSFITQNSFLTKIIISQNNPIILRVSLLTVKSQTPVGIKVQQYSPYDKLLKSFFIYIVPEIWKKKNISPNPRVNTVLFKKYLDEFPFRKNYFIAEWLQKIGFNLIINKITDPQDQLYMMKNLNKFIRSKIIEKLYQYNQGSDYG